MAKVEILNKTKVELHGLLPGKTKEIEVDKEGTPFDLHWRRRFKDAKKDGCLEIVKKEVKKMLDKTKEDNK